MEKLKEYLKENVTIDELEEMTLRVNAYNDELDFLNYWENGEEFFETFFEGRIDECVRAVCYGDYNYNDAYVRINVYGNLTSINEFEFETELSSYKDDIVDAYLDIYEEYPTFLEYDNVFKKIRDFENNENIEEEE